MISAACSCSSRAAISTCTASSPWSPIRPSADLAVLFMHNEGYRTMCGHAVIALGRWAVDSGRCRRLHGNAASPSNAPAAWCAPASVDGKAGRASRACRPSPSPSTRRWRCPAWRARSPRYRLWRRLLRLLPASRFDLDVRRSPTGARRCRPAVTEAAAQIPLAHPDDPDLAFLYGTILTDGADACAAEPTANICVFAASEVDRSPTGSGVTARLALQHARGLIALGQSRRFESITGALFTGKALATTRAGSFEAVTVEVGGKAHYTGEARFQFDDDDPLRDGFSLSS